MTDSQPLGPAATTTESGAVTSVDGAGPARHGEDVDTEAAFVVGLVPAAAEAWSNLLPADRQSLLAWAFQPRRRRARVRRAREIQEMLLLGPDVYYRLPYIIDGSGAF